MTLKHKIAIYNILLLTYNHNILKYKNRKNQVN